MWEGACPRLRWISQHMHCLTHRYREQAPSHIKPTRACSGHFVMPTAVYRFILAALLLLPFGAHAGDAEDFLSANPTQQAKLLQDWAAQPDPARIELVDALQQGQLTVNGETKTVRLNNRLRGLIDNVQASQQLLAADPKVRLAAAQTLQKTAQPAQLKFLDQRVAAETVEDVHTALSLALANLQLVTPTRWCASPPCACSAAPATRWPAPASKPCSPLAWKPTLRCIPPPRPAWPRSNAN